MRTDATLMNSDSHHSDSSALYSEQELSLIVRVGCKTDQGKRPNNEDSFFVDQDAGIFLVADGMGGQDDGEVASGLATMVIPEYLKEQLPNSQSPKKTIQEAMAEANKAIIKAGNKAENARRMGTTAVLAVRVGKRIYTTWLGDSRIYLVRGNKLQLLTVDHTLADALARNGDLSPEQAERSPWKHVLYKFLGCPDLKDKADVNYFVPEAGDRLVLASDGVTNFLKKEDLVVGATRFPDPEQWADLLVKLALKRDSKDNVTCVVLAFDEADN